MYVSTVRAYPGLELKNCSLECGEIVSVEDFARLDEAESGFCGRLYASAGIGRAYRWRKVVAVAGESCSPYRENGEIIEIRLILCGIALSAFDDCLVLSLFNSSVILPAAAEQTGQED